MTNTTTGASRYLPATTATAEVALKVYQQLQDDPEFSAFKAATLQYSSDWTCFDGTVVISKWDLESDKEPLFTEALRAVALKVAAFSLTGDEHLAEIPIAGPVDEMMHAMLAQSQILERISKRLGIQVIHQTDQENNDYRSGDYTSTVYWAAWGQPNPRFWLDCEVVEKRKLHLASLYQQIGIKQFGHSHDIEFAAA
ncbi:hypothetical protein OG497_38010 [Streptomyces sp. NBC_01242]|uniref:hypothetical protein n=1 Tax=Streptomyces sp. NBC_01242 TaxID=2903795 RepID=UPI00225385B3|nr:hypothetical protein [Streptomyces sp. NBC_01242]MCX4799655.1 hypothetical protein [Streptomyces sp. NBC_01242]